MNGTSSHSKGKSFRTGNEKTSKELFELYFRPACSFATSLLKNEQLAYDIVQEAFIRIWEKNILFNSIIRYKVYLYTTVRNAAYNHLQRSIPHKELNKEEKVIEEDAVDQMMIAAEIEAELLRQINLLPKSQRNVILLRLEGMTMEEIAKELHLSLNTVKTHKKRAYKQLRDKLGDIYFFLL